MSWTFNDIKYGWKIAAGITLAGTTIFVADNQRQRINQADVIEIVLGTYERCLATQYATNPLYRVDPPGFVREWQDTNGVVVVTNTIGWRIDRSMLADLDDTIKDLVPYFAPSWPTDTVAVVHTVTGLWAHLQIGDGTNQFTDYGWRVSTNALIERYKVLTELQLLQPSVVGLTPFDVEVYSGRGDRYATLAEAQSAAVSNYALVATNPVIPSPWRHWAHAQFSTHIFIDTPFTPGPYDAYLLSARAKLSATIPGREFTNSWLTPRFEFYIDFLSPKANGAIDEYDDFGAGLPYLTWAVVYHESGIFGSSDYVVETDYIGSAEPALWPVREPDPEEYYDRVKRGWEMYRADISYIRGRIYSTFDFQYATNKFWE
jgi:hypothetical protein